MDFSLLVGVWSGTMPVVGSDWIWELRVATEAGPALGPFFDLAAEYGLRPQRPDGLINLFTSPGAELRTVDDPATALAAMAAGTEYGQLWAGDDIDLFVHWNDGALTWALDAVFSHRQPTPEADGFRRLHARLTSLWLAAAQRLPADTGRVLDEWSCEQVSDWDIHDADRPVGGWPAVLGWWTYLGPTQHLPEPPLADVAARTCRLANGALLVTLLDDPAAVDPLGYADLHTRWLQVR